MSWLALDLQAWNGYKMLHHKASSLLLCVLNKTKMSQSWWCLFGFVVIRFDFQWSACGRKNLEFYSFCCVYYSPFVGRCLYSDPCHTWAKKTHPFFRCWWEILSLVYFGTQAVSQVTAFFFIFFYWKWNVSESWGSCFWFKKHLLDCIVRVFDKGLNSTFSCWAFYCMHAKPRE